MTTDMLSQAKMTLEAAPSAGARPAKGQQPSADAMRKSAMEFEAMFISQMLKPMFDSIPVDPVMGGGQGEEMFRSMLVDEYGKMMVKRGGIGLSDQVMQSMLKMQENRQ